jgi:hypothetical protein
MRGRRTISVDVPTVRRLGAAIGCAVLIALAVAACGGGSQSVVPKATVSLLPSKVHLPTATPGVSTGTCKGVDLTVVMRRTGGAAGSLIGFLRFTNDGTRSCAMIGWPTVTGVRAGGTTVRARQTRVRRHLDAVALAPGQHVVAPFSVRDGRCTDPFKTFDVTAPGTHRPVTVSAWMPALKRYVPACGTHRISIGPLESAHDPAAI